MEYLFHCHGISHTIASDQGVEFHTNEVWQCAQAHGIHWPYCAPIILKQLVLQNDGMAKSQW